MNYLKNAILIRVDGYKNIGMGHLHRMVTLAKLIKSNYDYEIIFLIRNNKASIDFISKNKFKYYPIRFNLSSKREIEIICQVIRIERPKAIILDILRNCHKKSFMNKLKVSIDGAVVVINGAHEKIFIEADIVINPSIGQDEKYYQHLRQTKYYLGPDYMILSPKFSEKSNNKKIKIEPEKVLVCMGGSDHQNLTYFVLKAIDKSKLDFSCDVILSSAFFDRKHIENQAKKLKHKINIFYDLKSLIDPLKQADLAITAGGNTLFDRLCLGVPGIVVNQLLHQTETSQKVMDYGATLNLGYYKYVSEQNLLDQFDSLMLNKNYRKKMSERGKSLVDGKGVYRVSEIIVGACK